MKLPRTTTGKYSIEAVVKALDVLESFSSGEDLTLDEVSRRVGMNKSRVFRLLQTLAERGYVNRCDGGRRYRLGAKLIERVSGMRGDIKYAARPVLRRMHERFNETLNLGILSDGDVLYIEIMESTRLYRMSATVGVRVPAHRTAMGKSMLAQFTSAELLPGTGLLSKSRKAILVKDLQRIRKRGYAIDAEENEPGVTCIGVSVLDASGHPVAAVSVSGPSHRILSREVEIARHLVAECRELSRSLGYNGLEPELPESILSLKKRPTNTPSPAKENPR
jgi:DNA-binding IclR family transcriptional regulator